MKYDMITLGSKIYFTIKSIPGDLEGTVESSSRKNGLRVKDVRYVLSGAPVFAWPQTVTVRFANIIAEVSNHAS